MSSANVLQSAPPEEPLYPILTAPTENFRLQMIDEMAKFLGQEVGHFRLVNKYKQAKNSLIGVLRAQVFSEQRFQARALVQLCLWLACQPQFY